MLIKQAPDIRSSEITDERVYRTRRQFIRAASGAAMGAVAGATVLGQYGGALHAQEPIPNLRKSPLSTDDDLNSYDDITSYNNFYEFGTDKEDPARYAHEMTTSPWSVRVEGEMNTPAVDMDIDDLLRDQGPDALGLDRHAFTEILRRHRGALKPTLMDQSVVAGLGNLLVDEICWRARLNPKVHIGELDDSDIRRLHRAVTSVLRTAVRHGCVPGLRRWLTRVRDDTDPSCPRCGTRVRRGRVGGRSTVWCPRCQPG